jgi:hypothetical protein
MQYQPVKFHFNTANQSVATTMQRFLCFFRTGAFFLAHTVIGTVYSNTCRSPIIVTFWVQYSICRCSELVCTDGLLLDYLLDLRNPYPLKKEKIKYWISEIIFDCAYQLRILIKCTFCPGSSHP